MLLLLLSKVIEVIEPCILLLLHTTHIHAHRVAHSHWITHLSSHHTASLHTLVEAHAGHWHEWLILLLLHLLILAHWIVVSK